MYVSCNPETNDYQKVLSTDDVIAPHKQMNIKFDYTQLPWITGSFRNHMICSRPTTSQTTFNDGYNVLYRVVLNRLVYWYSDQGSSHGGRRRAVPPGTANFRPALGFKLDAPPGTNRTKICWICTNSIVFQASKVVVFAQCKFCMHYFAKDTHHTAREQNYFLEKCSEPVHCDPFGRTAIRAPISELTPAQTLLGCARH